MKKRPLLTLVTPMAIALCGCSPFAKGSSVSSASGDSLSSIPPSDPSSESESDYETTSVSFTEAVFSNKYYASFKTNPAVSSLFGDESGFSYLLLDEEEAVNLSVTEDSFKLRVGDFSSFTEKSPHTYHFAWYDIEGRLYAEGSYVYPQSEAGEEVIAVTLSEGVFLNRWATFTPSVAVDSLMGEGSSFSYMSVDGARADSLISGSQFKVRVGDFSAYSETNPHTYEFAWHKEDGTLYAEASYVYAPETEDDSSSSSSDSSSETSDASPYVPSGYSLKWSDEFAGSSLDSSNWSYQTGDGYAANDCNSDLIGWGNSEKQEYQASNVSVNGGDLIITAKKETVTDTASGNTYNYTSGRIRTYAKVKGTYGYIEAKMKLPASSSTNQGLWPAFWMLPENPYTDNGASYTTWPTSGEIDIMECVCRTSTLSSALHYSTDISTYAHAYLTNSTTAYDISDWHYYGLKWTSEQIITYVDGTPVISYDKSSWNAAYGSADASPFNKDFYILFNLAVGGHFDGYRVPADSFESAEMHIDYVRWYTA